MTMTECEPPRGSAGCPICHQSYYVHLVSALVDRGEPPRAAGPDPNEHRRELSHWFAPPRRPAPNRPRRALLLAAIAGAALAVAALHRLPAGSDVTWASAG